MGDWCRFKKVELPFSYLEEAVVVIELEPTLERECEHGGALVEGVLLCRLFEGEATEKFGAEDALRYRQLVEFSQGGAGIDSRWRLCGECEGCTWNAKAVDSQTLWAKSDAQLCMDRWAQLCMELNMELELRPRTSLDYTVQYSTRKGVEIFCPSKSATSRPRHEHEEHGTGYNLRPNKKNGEDVPQLQFHVYWWLMAFVHERIEDCTRNTGLADVQVPVRAKFAKLYTKKIYNDPWYGPEVRECFSSEKFHKVSKPVDLTRLIYRFLVSKAESENHSNAWGFQGLHRPDVPNLEALVGTAVHIFANVLPRLRICQMYI